MILYRCTAELCLKTKWCKKRNPVIKEDILYSRSIHSIRFDSIVAYRFHKLHTDFIANVNVTNKLNSQLLHNETATKMRSLLKLL